MIPKLFESITLSSFCLTSRHPGPLDLGIVPLPSLRKPLENMNHLYVNLKRTNYPACERHLEGEGVAIF